MTGQVLFRLFAFFFAFYIAFVLPASQEADVPKTILELQQFRQSHSVPVTSRRVRQGTATLVNLNPAVNAWYLLRVAWKDGNVESAYHLENPAPQSRRLLLDEKYPSGLVIADGTARYACDLFGSDGLDKAKVSARIFYPLCEGRIYLRNPAAGNRTSLEAATEFLRDRLWGGERIIALGHTLLGDAQRETGKMQAEAQPEGARVGKEPAGMPFPALLDAKYANRLLTSDNLGIEWERFGKTGMTPGAWYGASGIPGVYVSILQPDLIDPAILRSYGTTVNALDSMEAASLSYLVAFDLDRFELGYALGTEHPRVGWSNHMLEKMRNSALPGPDGIGTVSPLVVTGLLNPEEARKTVATFTGGFKRAHGAFQYGELALRNHGSHYGFIENGVVFSKLQPGLATMVALTDGSIELKTWTEADDKRLAKIKHARQNGVPLIEFDAFSRVPVPGALVNRWGPGNWSGSGDRSLRTMRSGAALQRVGGKRYLIYGVFSSATPSAMARTFQAYRCDYAMMLDMNALEHTYLAVYRRIGSTMIVNHLLKGMSVLEKSAGGEVIPRFLGYADNRDFIYMMRRNGTEGKP